MGYRSDIGLALTKEAVVTLHQKLSKMDKNSVDYQNVIYMLSYPEKHLTDTDSGAEVYLWNSLKWYHGYPEIDFFEELMDSLDPEQYLFCRIGENLDDAEERGCFWDNSFNLGILRTITMTEPCHS